MKTVLIFLFLCYSCSSTFIYQANKKGNSFSKINKVITIAKFEDKREKYMQEDELIYGFHFIPLIFFDSYTLHKKNSKINFIQPDKMEFAFKKEFLSHGIYTDVYLENEDEEYADYKFTCKILKTDLMVTNSLYGISLFGFLFQALGVPESKKNLNMDLEFTLSEMKGKKILLSKTYSFNLTYLDSLYATRFGLVVKDSVQKQMEKFVKESNKILLEKK